MRSGWNIIGKCTTEQCNHRKDRRKYGIENRLPITLFIDEEGSEEYITSYYDVTHIIVDRDDEIQCLTYRKYDFMDLTADLICDIRKYFEDWVGWSPYEEEEEAEGKREKRLRDLIAETEFALEQEMERCHKVRQHDGVRNAD